MPESIFGPILSGSTIEDAIEALIKTWIGTYLAELADQTARSSVLPVPRAYNIRPSGEKWPEDQLPSVVVVNAGLELQPRVAGDGQYEADFRIGVVIVAKGIDADSARKNVADYAAAVRSLIVQKRGDLECSHLIWASESYEEAPPESDRSLAGAVVEFIITIPGILNKNRGPIGPPDPGQPGSSYGQVESTELLVTKAP